MPQRSVVTVGNFDGVHVGHRAIVARARQVADEHDAAVVAITFDPHPAAVLRPGAQPPRLTDLAERIALLREAGADAVRVIEPTRELLSQLPRQFIERLGAEHAPLAVVEGPNFRFGKDRAGDVRTLAELGRAMSFETIVVDPVETPLLDQLVAPVSSSLVRWLLAGGRVADAARCLGRGYALTAPVVKGAQRGRTLGVPTANLDLGALPGRVLPADGVYAGRAAFDDEDQTVEHLAAISIGVKPTFDGRRRVLEAHLLDYAGDLYGRRLTLRFARWLRDQQPFPNTEALRAQLRRDLAATRRLHETALPGWADFPGSARPTFNASATP